MSEPHTSELNFSDIYMYMYRTSCVHSTRKTLCTWSNWEHMRTLRFYSCFAASSEHVYIFWILPEKLWNHHKTRKTGYCAHENKRENLMCGRNSQAKAGKINEAERDRARCSTQTANAKFCMNTLLCIVHIYIANMQYIRNYHSAYKYMIQLARACPTMHRIHPVSIITYEVSSITEC